MIVAGLTGGIGCGKSEVSKMLSHAGYTVLDADKLARELSLSNTGIVRAIKEEFGENMYDGEGQLKRRDLAQIVFGDRKKLEKLNGIIHPRVIRSVELALEEKQKQGERVVFVEAALHYEIKWNEAMDLMIVVSAPMPLRLQRVMQRDRVDEAAVRQRMAMQLPLEEKVKKAEYVIENDGDLKQLQESVHRFIDWLNTRLAASPRT